MSFHVTQIIEGLLGREGGYVNHPSDRGGPTNWGITEAVARAYGYKGDMKLLPRETAKLIYEGRYWHDPKFATIYMTLPKVAEELFDTGVNMGTTVAGKFLQRALNTLNLRGKVFPDLEVDGRLGALTRGALKDLIAHRGKDATQIVLLRLLDAQQAVRYIELCEARETQEDFMFGWITHRIDNAR